MLVRLVPPLLLLLLLQPPPVRARKSRARDESLGVVSALLGA